MAIVIEQSVVTAVDTPSGSAASASWTPGSNELCLCLIANRGSNTPGNYNSAVSGNGLTWVNVLNQDDTQGQINLSVWRAMGASPTTGAVTVTFAVDPTACSFQLLRISGVKTTGTNGSGAIGNTASAETGATDTTPATTSVTTSANNSRVIGFASGRGQTYTVGSGFTAIQINQTANSGGSVVRSNSEYKDVATSGTATTTDFSLSAAGDWAIAAIEILIASGTTYTQSNAGTQSSSGALALKTLKALAGVQASSGALTRKTLKAVAGTQSSAGALTRKTLKAVAGVQASSGSLATAIIHLYQVAVAGVQASSGALSRKTLKALAGIQASLGALVALKIAAPAAAIALSLWQRVRSFTVRARNSFTVRRK